MFVGGWALADNQRLRPSPQEEFHVLHFPSSNTAAHRPATADVAQLDELLDDSVWAFSNCRVDAPGKPVAEVDWLFYNTRRGDFTVSEWKGFHSPVASVKDTGVPWILADGSEAANPIEQVARQHEAVRAVLRSSVRQQFFPTVPALDMTLQQCVYAPQIGPETTRERLRFGRVHGSLADLAQSLRENRTIPVPLHVADPAAHLDLADALAALFRCTVSRAARRKLAPSPVSQMEDSAQRIVDIHLQLSNLHSELARLMMKQPVEVKPAAPKQPVKAPRITEIEVMKTHLDKYLKNAGDDPQSVVKGLSRAWNAALRDPNMHRDGAVNQTVFGSAATSRVKHLGSLKELLGSSVPTWCLEQALSAGLSAKPDPRRSSHLLVSRT
ncbi:hypothetical protein [Arthrobacter sp. CAN_A1]|uniref:hypothetical protein n=1 Tax=Arthrobacter sp. CAN_A1 TaxID=2787717 RepID=UPI0018C9B74D